MSPAIQRGDGRSHAILACHGVSELPRLEPRRVLLAKAIIWAMAAALLPAKRGAAPWAATRAAQKN